MARRSLFKEIFQNFINSFKPKSYEGVFKGKDHNGTEYYEATRTSQATGRLSRWYTPVGKEDIELEIPPEWRAWLRYTRKEAPTEEEIELNKQKMLSTIANAQNLKKLEKTPVKETPKKVSSFPKYEEYTDNP